VWKWQFTYISWWGSWLQQYLHSPCLETDCVIACLDRVRTVATRGQLIEKESWCGFIGSKCNCWFNIKCYMKAVSLMLISTVYYNTMNH
jgi:hypothetical protein